MTAASLVSYSVLFNRKKKFINENLRADHNDIYDDNNDDNNNHNDNNYNHNNNHSTTTALLSVDEQLL